MTKEELKNSFYTIGFIGTIVTLCAYISKITYPPDDSAKKETYDEVFAMYLGYHHTKGGRINKGYICFDTDGNKQTTELKGIIDVFHLFEAGSSLKGKEGQTMKIAEWKKLKGLEKMTLIHNIQKEK